MLHSRANRAQYAEVALQTFVETDIQSISLPSVQGLAEDAGEFLSRLYIV